MYTKSFEPLARYGWERGKIDENGYFSIRSFDLGNQNSDINNKYLTRSQDANGVQFVLEGKNLFLSS